VQSGLGTSEAPVAVEGVVAVVVAEAVAGVGAVVAVVAWAEATSDDLVAAAAAAALLALAVVVAEAFATVVVVLAGAPVVGVGLRVVADKHVAEPKIAAYALESEAELQVFLRAEFGRVVHTALGVAPGIALEEAFVGIEVVTEGMFVKEVGDCFDLEG